MTADTSDPQHLLAARVQALRRAAAARTREAERAAESGIRTLIKDGGQISFRAVARAGNVSTKFLHRHPELSTRIRTLRAQQRGQAEAMHATTVSGDNAVIAALRRQMRQETERNRRREAEFRLRIKELEGQIAVLYGRLRTLAHSDRIDGTPLDS